MKEIKQAINGYRIPLYMEEILTHNYCPNFLRMSMVREDNDYHFSYQTERYKRLDISKLDTYSKLVLLRSIINLNEKNEDWLIKAENYLIEPELIYSINNCVDDGSVRLLFYPDSKRMSFNNKIILFAEKIINRKEHSEAELIEKFRTVAEQGDWNRTRLFLDKHILRMQAGMSAAV